MNFFYAGKSISGRVFADLNEKELKEFGFVGAGYYAMRSVLREVLYYIRYNMCYYCHYSYNLILRFSRFSLLYLLFDYR